MSRPRRNCGESQEDYIRRASLALYNDGYYINEIAEKLKTDTLTVYNNLVIGSKRITNEDERAVMIELRGKGLSYRKIAAEVGRSATCVRERINAPAKYRHDLSEYHLTDRQLKNLKKWYLEGKSLKWIAEKLNIGVHSVKYRLIRAGIFEKERNPKRITTKEMYKFNTLRKKGYTIEKIAKECNRSVYSVRKYLNKFS